MSRKGRRRSNKAGRARGHRESVARALDATPSLVPAPDSSPSLVPAPDSSSMLAFALASSPAPSFDDTPTDALTTAPAPVATYEPAPSFDLPPSCEPAPDSAPALSFEAPLGSQRPPPLEPADASVPPVVGDLDGPFLDTRIFDTPFFELTPSEFWLAELETRDPRWLLKMTAAAARRRAHLARYVLGAVGISAVLCLAALVRVVVPSHDDGDLRPAARMTMPPSDPASDLSDPAPAVHAADPTAEPAKTGAPDAGPG